MLTHDLSGFNRIAQTKTTEVVAICVISIVVMVDLLSSEKSQFASGMSGAWIVKV